MSKNASSRVRGIKYSTCASWALAVLFIFNFQLRPDHGLSWMAGAEAAEYLGCFRDQGDPQGLKGRDLAGAIMSAPTMTGAQCVSTCQAKGYAYAGTQYGSYCFCGDSYGKSGVAKCGMPCAGNPSETCGGPWANSVYAVPGITGPSTQMPVATITPENTTQNMTLGDAAAEAAALINPKTLLAVDRGEGRVDLQWPAVSGVNLYRIDGTGIPSTGRLTGSTSASVSGLSTGRGTWQVVATTRSNAIGKGPVPHASILVRVLPTHAAPWLTKNNGPGNISQVQLPVEGCYFGDSLLAPSYNGPFFDGSFMMQVSAEGKWGSCLKAELSEAEAAEKERFNYLYEPPTFPTIPFMAAWLGTKMPLWFTPGAAGNEAVYGNSGDLGVGRRTACEQQFDRMSVTRSKNKPVLGEPKAIKTICYATAHGSTPGSPGFNDPQTITHPQAGIDKDFILSMVIVKDPTGTVFLALSKSHSLLPAVGLDTEGPKLVPFVCLSCHGGRYNPETRKVDGASLLPLDPNLLVFATPGDRDAQEEKFRAINAIIARAESSTAIAAYIQGLYNGAVDRPGARAQVDYVPAGWAPQTGFYRQVVRPYCAMCHLAAPSQWNFASWGNFQANKEPIHTAVCGSAHSMPHGELQFKSFWTKDTGDLYLPGLLAVTLGFQSC